MISYSSLEKYSKGFTLIELMVVVAIIGVLSSVVLSALGTARTKGKDAAVKGAMASSRAQAEIYYSLNGNYGSTADSCASGVFSDTRFAAIRTNVTNNGATGVLCTTDTDTNANTWAYSVTLPSGGSTFCVDANGKAAMSSTAQGTGLCG